MIYDKFFVFAVNSVGECLVGIQELHMTTVLQDPELLLIGTVFIVITCFICFSEGYRTRQLQGNLIIHLA